MKKNQMAGKLVEITDRLENTFYRINDKCLVFNTAVRLNINKLQMRWTLKQADSRFLRRITEQLDQRAPAGQVKADSSGYLL